MYMERRMLLKRMALLGLAAAIPFKQTLSAAFFKSSKRPFHRFNLGELELTVITDGHISLSPVQPHFPNGNEAQEKELLRKSFRPTEAVDLGMNILLIKKGTELILLDTGTGGSFGPDSGWLLASLSDAGMEPAQITAIVISHAHPDHIGGLLSATGAFVFPNATIHMSAVEHAFWMAPQQDFSKSKFQDKKLLETFATAIRKVLTTIQPKLHLFQNNSILFNCLRMQLAPGHTPGHTITYVFSGKEEMVHIADLMHSDVLLFPHPEWGFDGDTDIQLAATTRKQVLAILAQTQTKVFGYHLPWPGIGHVRTQGEGYEWIAETYAFPG
ncbi:metallo-beta-lactamase family protein [Filimonas lacunae]|nr:metallo-beta-lactamase family protein [Filimonas lacunae]